jgi:heat shock protein HslJ
MRMSRHITPTTTVPRGVADGSTPARRPRRVAHPRSGSRRAPLVLLAVVAVLSLGACGDSAPDLDGRSYTSTEVRGHDLVAGTTVTLTFEDGRISANAGCNTMNGTATWDGGTLDVAEPMASTMMACEDDLAAQDQWLSSFLTSSPALEVEGDTLTLGDASSGMTLTAKP